MRNKRKQLAKARKNAGLTQEGLAYRLDVDRSTVGRWEVGSTEPSAWLRPRLAKSLGITRTELGELLADRAESTSQGSAGASSGVDAIHSDIDYSVLPSVLGPSATLALLDEYTQSIISRYELEGPRRLAPEVQALRRLCRDLGRQLTRANDHAALARISGRQSALLAYMAVNLGRFVDAERYALEASLLASAAEDRSPLAWVRGTQSFAAYYQQRYDLALAVAEAGVQLAGRGNQRIRLLSNGVARAAGKLKDRSTVDQAVNEALELSEAQDGPAEMTSCIEFAPYGWARTAANAATAYLSVGDYSRALKLTHQVRTVVATSDSDWSRSLVYLDEAKALAESPHADLEHSANLGVMALSASASKPIASVARRATELAVSLRRHGKSQVGQQFATNLQEWERRQVGHSG